MTECWLWQGHLNSKGYGHYWVRDVVVPYKQLAHRKAYEQWWGPIPAGKQLDHLCGVRRCVNPLHLEVVTCRENLLRSAKTWAARNAGKQTCHRGHPFDRVDRDGWRVCGTCRRLRKAGATA